MQQEDLSQAVLPLQPAGHRRQSRYPANNWTAGYRNTTDPLTRQNSRQTSLAQRADARLFAFLIGSSRSSRRIPRSSTGIRLSSRPANECTAHSPRNRQRYDYSAAARNVKWRQLALFGNEKTEEPD